MGRVGDLKNRKTDATKPINDMAPPTIPTIAGIGNPSKPPVTKIAFTEVLGGNLAIARASSTVKTFSGLATLRRSV